MASIDPQDEDERYNTPQFLADAEFGAGGESKSGAGFSDEEKQRLNDIHKTDQIDAAESVRNKEQSAGNPMNFKDEGRKNQRKNATGTAAAASSIAAGFATGNPITALNAARKAGPLALMISIVLGLGALFLGSYTLLPVHLYENFLSKYDSNQTSYTYRTNKIITSKLANTNTTCLVANIACRFKRPSNFMLKQLTASGVTAVDGTGAAIEDKGVWPNKKTVTLKFTDSTGGQHEVNASGLYKALNNTKDPLDAEFSAALHNGLKTRLQVFSDSIFKAVAGKFDFSKLNPLKDATSEDDANKKINADAAGDEAATDAEGGTTGGEEGESDTAQEVKDKLGAEVQDVNDKETGGKVGNLFGNIAGAACIAADVPGIFEDTGRAVQLAQLVRLGDEFMVVASALKAGDATPVEVSTFTDNLTKEVDGKSALDSPGIKDTLYGDTARPNKKYIPGALVEDNVGGLAAATNDPGVKNVKEGICAIATNPLTGAAIDASGAVDFGLTDVVNIVGGIAEQEAQNLAIQFVLPKILDLVPDSVWENIAETVFGDITKDLAGENFGDALSSGSAHLLGQLANAGGNAPLSLADAVAYDGKTAEVNLAYAQEDRATLSPLDASNQNTFMGTIVNSLTPLYSSMSSLTGIMSSFSSIAGTAATGVLMGNSYAATADDSAQYKLCNDPSLTNGSGDTVAAGPFCNIQYGIPLKYLDMDPQDIVTDLVNAKQIDDSTGEAIDGADPYTVAPDRATALGVDATGQGQVESYSQWLKTCTDGTAEEAINCKITNGQLAEYALYTIDHRIQKNIDNEDTAPTGTVADTTTTVDTSSIPNTCSNTEQTGSGITAYSKLSGSPFDTRVNSAGSSATVSLPAGSFTFSNFSSKGGKVGAYITTSGLIGAGISNSVISMNANTSTKAGQIPTGTLEVNPLFLLSFTNNLKKLDCFSLKGTDQGHLYNGIGMSGVSNASISNILLDDASPGNDHQPPGETMAFNDFHGSNNTYKNVEINGASKGASGFGLNSSSGGTWVTSSAHDLKYSNGWAFWQHTGGATIEDSSTLNNRGGVNLEQSTGTFNLNNMKFGGNTDSDISGGNNQSTNMMVIVRDPVLVGETKLRVRWFTKEAGAADKLGKKNIQVLVNGVDKTDSMIQWLGVGAG